MGKGKIDNERLTSSKLISKGCDMKIPNEILIKCKREDADSE